MAIKAVFKLFWQIYLQFWGYKNNKVIKSPKKPMIFNRLYMVVLQLLCNGVTVTL